MNFDHFPLDHIQNNPWQTRHSDPDPEYIRALADDIRANGLLQIPVGRMIDREHVQLAFGHNRLTAYQLLTHEDEHTYGNLPVEIRALTDEQMANYAWAENEKRLANSPVDRALSIRQRMEQFGWSQEQVAEHLHMSRPAVANSLRLLKLPDDVQASLTSGELSERQALALIPLSELPKAMLERAERGGVWKGPSNILKSAKNGESSDRIRESVNNLINQYSQPLEKAPWPLDHDFVGNVFVSPICRECPLRLKHQNRCPDRDCYQAKEATWQAERLAAASQASGIKILEKDIDVWKCQHFWGEEAHIPAIRQNGCEHLRLYYGNGSQSQHNGLADLGYPEVHFICHYKNKECACLLAMKGDADRIDSQVIDKLEAARRVNKKVVKKILEAGAAIFAQGLADEEIGAWRKLLYLVSYSARDRNDSYDLDKIRLVMGKVSLPIFWQNIDDPDSALKTVNEQLRDFGLPEIDPLVGLGEVPEDSPMAEINVEKE